jgi:hypothetical protein
MNVMKVREEWRITYVPYRVEMCKIGFESVPDSARLERPSEVQGLSISIGQSGGRNGSC